MAFADASQITRRASVACITGAPPTRRPLNRASPADASPTARRRGPGERVRLAARSPTRRTSSDPNAAIGQRNRPNASRVRATWRGSYPSRWAPTQSTAAGLPPPRSRSEAQRLGRERPVALAGDHRVHDVQDAALRRVGERSVGPPVVEDAVQVEAGPPDRVVTRPRALDADLVAHSQRDPAEDVARWCSTRARGCPGRARGSTDRARSRSPA